MTTANLPGSCSWVRASTWRVVESMNSVSVMSTTMLAGRHSNSSRAASNWVMLLMSSSPSHSDASNSSITRFSDAPSKTLPLHRCPAKIDEVRRSGKRGSPSYEECRGREGRPIQRRLPYRRQCDIPTDASVHSARSQPLDNPLPRRWYRRWHRRNHQCHPTPIFFHIARDYPQTPNHNLISNNPP